VIGTGGRRSGERQGILEKLHRESKNDTKLLSITSRSINRFSNFFTIGFSSKLATNSCLNFPPRFKHVPIHYLVEYVSEKWHQSEIYIVIRSNDKPQGNIAKHLRCDELLYYTFIIQSAGKRILKIGEHLAKLRT